MCVTICFNHVKEYCIADKNISTNGTVVNILVFVGHKVSAETTQLCISELKQLQTSC
jgi:hypothetical protein